MAIGIEPIEEALTLARVEKSGGGLMEGQVLHRPRQNGGEAVWRRCAFIIGL